MVRIRIPSLAEVFGFDERWLRANLSLLDNAKESILHGLEHYLEPDPSASHFKQAVINLHLGFELALKEALRRKHEAFILGSFSVEILNSLIRGDQLLEEGPATGTIRTISFEEAVNRAKELLELGPEPAKFLLELNRLRRAAVHYSFRLDQRSLEMLLGTHLYSALRIVFTEILGEDLGFVPAPVRETLVGIQKRLSDPIALNLLKRIAQGKEAWSRLSDIDRKTKLSAALGLRKPGVKLEVCPACGERSFEARTEWRVIDHDPEGRPVDIPVTTNARCACCPFEIDGDEAVYYCDWKGLSA